MYSIGFISHNVREGQDGPLTGFRSTTHQTNASVCSLVYLTNSNFVVIDLAIRRPACRPKVFAKQKESKKGQFDGRPMQMPSDRNAKARVRIAFLCLFVFMIVFS